MSSSRFQFVPYKELLQHKRNLLVIWAYLLWQEIKSEHFVYQPQLIRQRGMERWSWRWRSERKWDGVQAEGTISFLFRFYSRQRYDKGFPLFPTKTSTIHFIQPIIWCLLWITVNTVEWKCTIINSWRLITAEWNRMENVTPDFIL